MDQSLCQQDLVAAAPNVSFAQYSGITGSELQTALRNAGIAVNATPASNIYSVDGGFILLIACNSSGRCGEVAFFNNFPHVRPTLEAVNRWNNTFRIPEASLNPDGTLHMEMWLSGFGLTDTLLVDTLGWFRGYLFDKEFWGPYVMSPGT